MRETIGPFSSVKMFGDTKVAHLGDHDFKSHVLVAVRGGWAFFCHSRPSTYETVEPEPKPTAEPVVWLHDREQIDCAFCLALLDGKAIEFVPVTP